MCFSVGFFFQLCIWLVVIGALYAIIKVVLPAVLANFGGPGTLLGQVINIVLYAVMLILVLYLIWDLVDCLVGAGGISRPRLR
jgi:hypothetical protein